MGETEALYDPIELGTKIREKVCIPDQKDPRRRVYRFRGDRWYGGIATADVVGCNLRCRFCWAWRTSSYRTDVGRFTGARETAEKLVKIAYKKGFSKARLSGGEPLLCPEHVFSTASLLEDKDLLFIVETNGIPVTPIEDIVARLKTLENTVLRISLKGCNEKVFSRTTGSVPQGFSHQLSTIEKLVEAGLEPGKHFWVSAMISFCTPKEIEELLQRLESIDYRVKKYFEAETIILYPHVKALLKKFGLEPTTYNWR
jgi:uncharacterized Fe-S cluster-containing radical SAM superfamily protein